MRHILLAAVFVISLCGVGIALDAPNPQSFAVTTDNSPRLSTLEVDIKKPMKKCRACHGKDLGGKKKAPNISGWASGKVKKSLTTDIPKSMKAVTKKLTPEQIDAISAAISKMPKIEKKTE
jgi:cytochrome c553